MLETSARSANGSEVKDEYVVQDNDVAYGVFWVESSAGIRHCGQEYPQRCVHAKGGQRLGLPMRFSTPSSRSTLTGMVTSSAS